MILLIGVVALGFLYVNRYKKDVPVEGLSPSSTLILWQRELRHGVEYQPPWKEAYFEWLKHHNRWQNVAGTLAGVGVLVMLGSLLIPKKKILKKKVLKRRTNPT